MLWESVRKGCVNSSFMADGMDGWDWMGGWCSTGKIYDIFCARKKKKKKAYVLFFIFGNIGSLSFPAFVLRSLLVGSFVRFFNARKGGWWELPAPPNLAPYNKGHLCQYDFPFSSPSKASSEYPFLISQPPSYSLYPPCHKNPQTGFLP